MIFRQLTVIILFASTVWMVPHEGDGELRMGLRLRPHVYYLWEDQEDNDESEVLSTWQRVAPYVAVSGNESRVGAGGIEFFGPHVTEGRIDVEDRPLHDYRIHQDGSTETFERKERDYSLTS